MRERAKALVLSMNDNVATALEALEAGSTVPVDKAGQTERVKLLSSIPAGHKFAVVELEEGDGILKYGEPIGTATSRIVKGAHVHVHNVRGTRRLG